MRLTIDQDGVPHEVDVVQRVEAATIADLVESAIGVRPADDESWHVDEQQHDAGTRLNDVVLLDGTTIARTSLRRASRVGGWTATLSGGLHAGPTVGVPTSRPMTLGRSPQADVTIDSPSASWNHVSITREAATDDVPEGLRVRDEGSTNGTTVDGDEVGDEGVLVTGEAVVLAGGVAITLRPSMDETAAPAPGTLHNLTPAGTAPFNRPPRPGRPPAPDAVEPPSTKDDPPPVRFSMATVLAPLAMAAVMVIVMRNPMFAMIALMSPVLGIGTWLEQKRRRTADITDETERFDAAVTTFADDLREAAAEERRLRRAAYPDPATALRAASLPTTRLWQRRADANDFLVLHAGVADVPWAPSLDTSSRGGKLHERVQAVVDEVTLPAAPVEVDLTNAGVVGIVGEREGALAVARSLVCQATTQAGPADLTVGVFCDQGRDQDWSWSSWLPHVRRLGDGAGGQWTSADRSRSEGMLRRLREGIEGHPTRGVLLVLDSDVLTEGRDAPARALLGHGRPETTLTTQKPVTQVSGIVIAATEEQLPASCTTVIDVRHDAEGTVTRPDDLHTIEGVVLAGLDAETARRCALDLARFDDPELIVPGASLPGMVRLPPLLGFEELTPEVITEAWATSTGVGTPVGIGEEGGFHLDLVRDGPHGLVGGTTGSGKSEFLRSMVAGLAARNDPTKLTFILIDFKGGAAFATCERLPHTIGTVSNLDEQLADRALRALEAEMRYRQEVFAAAGEGIDNLNAYLATNPETPMPRLLLVVDEFAMLAKEYPDVLSSLVSVAAVGRTLGVHMILATQRPAGVVNEDILANTNLRVALRVQSREDSSNVVGVPDAAAIGRTQMGRALVKLGQDDITPVQTALVTGRAEAQAAHVVELQEVVFGRDPQPRAAAPTSSDDDATDLDLLIDAVVAANDAAGYGPPRPVWPEALGERVELQLDRLGPVDSPLPVVGGTVDDVVRFGVADEPDRQRQVPAGWDLDQGNLMLLGIPGSGTSTTLASVALVLADTHAPDELDLFVLDMGPRDLAVLADLPHTAAYVGSGAASREQQVRLLKHVREELDRRRAAPGPHRRTVVLIDGLGALKDEYSDFEGLALLEGLYRAYSDGPDVGIHFAVTTSRSKSVPTAIDEVTTQKWLFRLADTYDYSSAGVPSKLAPPPIAGRCVLAETQLQAHVGTPAGGLADAVARLRESWGTDAKRQVIGQLPESITVSELGLVSQLAGEPWQVPVGIRESTLEPAVLELFENEHMMITGPARSGRSSLLLGIAQSLRAGARQQGVDLAVWGVASRRSPLATADLDRVVVGDDGLAALLAEARIHDTPLALLVDDAEQLDDADQSIANLLAARLPHLHVFAAGRSDDLRSMYSHWTKAVRKSRCGVLLQPNIDYDGELLGVTLPRRSPVVLSTGRGYAAMGGGLDVVQGVRPDPDGAPEQPDTPGPATVVSGAA